MPRPKSLTCKAANFGIIELLCISLSLSLFFCKYLFYGRSSLEVGLNVVCVLRNLLLFCDFSHEGAEKQQ